MRKLIAASLIALGTLGLAACSKGEEGATANAAESNLSVGEGDYGNDVTAVDSDTAVGNAGAADLNAADAAPNASDLNAADAAGNLAEPTGNGL